MATSQNQDKCEYQAASLILVPCLMGMYCQETLLEPKAVTRAVKFATLGKSGRATYNEMENDLGAGGDRWPKTNPYEMQQWSREKKNAGGTLNGLKEGR